MEEWELFGFIKEEENKYYMRNLAGEEGLVYDFTVNLGDTITINNPYGFMDLDATVINIDSVLIEPANEYRKRITLFEFTNFYYEEQWIDGIGSLAGLTQSSWDMSLITGGDDFTLLCYYENEEIYFKTDLHPLCFYPIVKIPQNKPKEDNITLSPHPILKTSYLKIDYPESRYLTVKIFNSTGSLVEINQLITPAQVEINSINYQKGIYFYQVINGNKTIFSSKFIIL